MGLLNRIRHVITAALAAAREPMEGRGAPRLMPPSPQASTTPEPAPAEAPARKVVLLGEYLKKHVAWDDHPLGFAPDTFIGERIGVRDQSVFGYRKRRGIPALKRSPVTWYERRDVWQAWLAGWGEDRIRTWLTRYAPELLDVLQAAVDFDEDATRPRKPKAPKAAPKPTTPPQPKVSAPPVVVAAPRVVAAPAVVATPTPVDEPRPVHPPRANAPKFWPDAPPAPVAAPPVMVRGEAETVEQFVARGGQITRATPVMPTEPPTRPCFPNRT